MYGVIIIDQNEFSLMPIYHFEKKMREKHVAMKVITGYTFDNTHLCVSNMYGEWFSISVRRSQAVRGSIGYKKHQEMFGRNIDPGKVFELHAWDYRGLDSIYTRTFEIKDYDKPIPMEICRELFKSSEKYSKGFIRCSDCRKEIKIEDKGGCYFASTFCIDCWLGKRGKHKGNKGWQEIERRETYD